MRRSTLLLAILAVSCFAPQSGAVTVEYTLYLGPFAQGPGTFKLTAQVSVGDNFGLASYGVQLVDSSTVSGGILSVNNTSLRAGDLVNVDGEGSAGFTVVRLPDFALDTLPKLDEYRLNGSLDTVTPTPFLIRGFGQTPGSIATSLTQPTTGTVSEGDPWGNAGITTANHTATPGEFELARGTYIPTADGGLGFNPNPDLRTHAEVFTAATFILTEAVPLANITRTVVIPEPSALTIAAASLVGLSLIRRRSLR